ETRPPSAAANSTICGVRMMIQNPRLMQSVNNNLSLQIREANQYRVAETRPPSMKRVSETHRIYESITGKDHPRGVNHRDHRHQQSGDEENGRNRGKVVRSVRRHSSHHRLRNYIVNERGLSARDGGGGCLQGPKGVSF
ncbi:hypothetical protein A2U01_0044700, partial [Trifolium medium]|nr:hypothetical protein [Trifolium medium]